MDYGYNIINNIITKAMRLIINKDDSNNLEKVFDLVKKLNGIAYDLINAEKPSSMLVLRSIISLDEYAFDLGTITRELYNTMSKRINSTFAIPEETTTE